MHCTLLEKPKAKKQHRCMSCGEPIAAGETYYRWRTYMDGGAGTDKMHPECYEMHDAEGAQWEYSPYSYERPHVVPNVKLRGDAQAASLLNDGLGNERINDEPVSM